ncbi:MAG: hypothetical protein ACLGIC_06630 [Acidimicrobiia bacterium]
MARPLDPLVRLLRFVVPVAVVLLAGACGDDDEVTTTATESGGDDDAPSLAAPGRVHVRLEEVDGFFIEGFEVGLRFETGEGETIASTLWSDVVASSGADGIEAFYDTVLTQEVPAGLVRIAAEVNVGMGPGPSIPDLAGPLPCQVEVEIPPEGEATVEVSFSGGEDCLRVVEPDGEATADPEVPSSVPTTSTTAPAGPAAPPDLEVGTSHTVDVDLECQAFELGGATWVLVDGDTSTWQPPGERHEGGTFTIEAPGHRGAGASSAMPPRRRWRCSSGCPRGPSRPAAPSLVPDH